MDELEALRQKASTLITQSGDDPGALERGALLLRTVAEVEKDRAEAQRLRHEASGGRANALDYVKVLAPWATVLVSLATIMVQSFQSHTARAAEKWERTFYAVSNGTANLADVVEFSGFLNTKEHKQDARVAAANFLKAGPANLATFKLLFNKLYTDKIVPSDRDDVLDIDRGILENLNAIEGKNAKLENTLYDELNYITAEITPVLRNRKPDDPLDLQRVILLDGDLSKADLSGARLDGFDPERIDFHGATLKANDSQGYADKWIHSAWWEASSVNLEFLKNLEEKAPFNHAITYSRSIKFTLPEYCQRTADLGMFDTQHCPVRTK